MDKEDIIASECIEYMTKISKKMSYEGIADQEDIMSLGNLVYGICKKEFDPNKSPNFVLYFKNRFLLSIKDFKKKPKNIAFYSLDSEEYQEKDFEDLKVNTENNLSKEETKKILSSMMHRLSFLERKIVVMKFIDKMKQKDISLLVGKTEARISQIIPEILNKLRTMPEYNSLKDMFG